MFSNSKIIKNFIVFEGLDGSGTSTQQQKLTKEFHRRGIPSYSTSEPTSNSIGILIRSILSSNTNITVTRSTLARLFAADRNEHLYGPGGIMDETGRGKLVICDRYLFSSLAYQGSDIGIDPVWELNKDFPLPEILFFFDIDPQEAEKRYKVRKNLDIYENRTSHKKVRSTYDKIFSDLGKTAVNIHRIDASKNVEETFREMWRVLATYPIFK